MKKRVVAIVGRPNVGKSAIFNRLVRRRIAIVHEQSGVTRDRLMREVSWDNSKFELVDTGGVSNVDRATSADLIEAGIHEQVNAALEDASVAVLVTDITKGRLPLDEEIASHLRGKGCHVLVAANKADSESRDEDADEFAGFGFPVYPVSALHDRGFGSLMADVVAALPEEDNITISEPLKVAVVGRPNVGKSSYLNRLLRSQRVIVSDVPGTTRDSVDMPFSVGTGDQARHYLLIDTAGIRRMGKINNAVERYGRFRAEKSIRRADVVVHVLDAEQRPTAQDRKIAGLVAKHDKGCVLLVNKWDLEETTQRQYIPEIEREMPFMGHCPVAFVSAKTGYNIRRSVDVIDHVAAQVTADLPTGVLNRVLIEAYEKRQPLAVRGKRLKLFYSTQVGKEPIRVRLFVNEPKGIQPNYRAYLVRQLRHAFGLEGAPVILQFRGRRSEK